MNRKLGLDAVSNYLRFAIAASVPFLLTPKMLSSFGTDGFGLWSLTHSMLSLFGLLDLGLSSTLVRYLAVYRKEGKANLLIGTVLTIYLGLSFLGLSILAGVSFWAAPFNNSDQAWCLLWLLGFRNITICLPLGVLRSALHAQQAFIACNTWQAILSLLYGLSAWVLLAVGGEMMTLAALLLMFALVEHIGYLVLLRRALPGFRMLPGIIDRKSVKKIWSFSLASTMSTLAGIILLKTDPIIVAFFLPLSAVTSYSLALKLAEGVLMLLKQAVNVLTPQFSKMWCDGQTSELAQLYLKACRISLLAASIVGLPVIIYAPQLLQAWVGEADSASVAVTRILVLAALLSVPQMISSAALSMGGHHTFTAKAAAISTGLNLLLSIVLVPTFGLVGVALGTLTATILIDLALVTRTAVQVLGVKSRKLFQALPVLPISIQLLLLVLAPASPSIPSITVHSGLAGALALATYRLRKVSK